MSSARAARFRVCIHPNNTQRLALRRVATRAMPRPLARRDALRKVKYGRSDMVVSELCAGSMTWGSFNGSEEEAHAQLDCFVKNGVNFFDTAELYPVGWNYGRTTETWMGNWLAARTKSGAVKREDLYFATKCNPLGTGGTVGKPGKWKKHAFDAGRLRASCEASLARLQCDYIDLYMLHFPSRMGGEAFGDGLEGGPRREGPARVHEGQDARTTLEPLVAHVLQQFGRGRRRGDGHEEGSRAPGARLFGGEEGLLQRGCLTTVAEDSNDHDGEGTAADAPDIC